MSVSNIPPNAIAPPSVVTWAQLAVVAAVAASHMSMPNHWLPYSLVARAQSWTLRKTLLLSTLTKQCIHIVHKKKRLTPFLFF